MSLSVLYCEGNSKSLDIRLLQQLLPGTCLIKPIGGKFYGFEDKIISDRTINPKLAGLRDRDFDCRDFRIANRPIEWFYQNLQIGWFWERKEIENYLIDPEVVARSTAKHRQWMNTKPHLKERQKLFQTIQQLELLCHVTAFKTLGETKLTKHTASLNYRSWEKTNVRIK